MGLHLQTDCSERSKCMEWNGGNEDGDQRVTEGWGIGDVGRRADSCVILDHVP